MQWLPGAQRPAPGPAHLAPLGGTGSEPTVPRCPRHLGAGGEGGRPPALFGGGGALAELQQGVGGVVLEEGLEEHADGAKDTDEDEDPQEEAVDDHGHVLPVLAHLHGAGRNSVSPGVELPCTSFALTARVPAGSAPRCSAEPQICTLSTAAPGAASSPQHSPRALPQPLC